MQALRQAWAELEKKFVDSLSSQDTEEGKQRLQEFRDTLRIVFMTGVIQACAVMQRQFPDTMPTTVMITQQVMTLLYGGSSLADEKQRDVH